RARADNLAQRSVGRQRQKVPRKVERAGAQDALVEVRLHLNRPGYAVPQIAEHLLREVTIFGEQEVDGLAVQGARAGILRKIGNKISALLEILIAGGAFLSVPAWFVDDYGGGKNRQSFDGKSQVRQIRDAAMSVLKIEGIKELFGPLLIQFSQRFPHGER